MEGTIVNKVANSGIITLNLEEYFPKEAVTVFDLKDYLFMGLILKEKDFRQQLSQTDWEQYTDKNVTITCSADAIIPNWAYMLVTTYLQPIAKSVYYGDEAAFISQYVIRRIEESEGFPFSDKRVVIKGCGENDMPAGAFIAITQKLLPFVKSLMYGEPCSTVPVFKKK